MTTDYEKMRARAIRDAELFFSGTTPNLELLKKVWAGYLRPIIRIPPPDRARRGPVIEVEYDH